MITKKTKLYVTNVQPNTQVLIDGPCSMIVKGLNSSGQIELSFEVSRDTTIDKFKLESTVREITNHNEVTRKMPIRAYRKNE
jgi:hypothetical protein